MTAQILIPESMLDDFESTWRRRQRLAMRVANNIGWMMLVLSAIFLAYAVGMLLMGKNVSGLTFLACVPIPFVSLGLIHIILRRERRRIDRVLRTIEDIRRRGSTAGGRS